MIILHLNECVEFFNDMKKRNKVVAVSGYFDPPTPAHLAYFRSAKKLGDVLVVLLNTDEQLLRKRSGTALEDKVRYQFIDRALIIDEFKVVSIVVKVIDPTNTVSETLRVVRPHIFAKGGDRDLTNLPKDEISVCNEIGCKIIIGVGGKKTHSSSWYDWS